MTIDLVVILTKFGRHDGDIVLGDALSVKEFVCGNGSLHWINVKVAVQVTLPVNGIPERKMFV